MSSDKDSFDKVSFGPPIKEFGTFFVDQSEGLSGPVHKSEEESRPKCRSKEVFLLKFMDPSCRNGFILVLI